MAAKPDARKAPFFQFFPSDWLGSSRVEMMSLEQQGAYLRLLCHQWGDQETCSLPADDRSLSRLSRLGSRWEQEKAEIVECFEPHPSIEGRIVNQRLYDLWTERQAFIERQSNAGKASAAARGEPYPQPEGNRMATGVQPDPQPEGKSPSPSPLPSPNTITTTTATEEKRRTSSGSKDKRGRVRARRCPPDFELTPERREAAAEIGVLAADVDREFGAFRDWEYRDPKSDWDAAWRNWCRKYLERTGGGNGAASNVRPLPQRGGFGTASERTADASRQNMQRAAEKEARLRAEGKL